MTSVDVAVVGAGPAGLASAICAAQRGLNTLVLERAVLPADKACGEGLMPAGVEALERMGARALLAPGEWAPFVGIRYVETDGSALEGRLPPPGGLGVRRPALVEALAARARALGVEVRERCRVLAHTRGAHGMYLTTEAGEVRARLLVAADGLASPLRRAESLEGAHQRLRRYGLRRHFRCAPWSPWVEVHFSRGVEAYVTPAGADRVGVAFLWADGEVEPVTFGALLERFPRLGARLAGAEADSAVRGAGPLWRSVRARVADRFVLVGDAAGYVDAVTGEGLSLAFAGAEALGALLPGALARGAGREALLPYEAACTRAFRRYALVTRAVLALSRRPRLRGALVRALARRPLLFERLLRCALR